MSEVKMYYVLRAPDLNFAFEGRWYDTPTPTLVGGTGLDITKEYQVFLTDKTETRADGSRATVLEIRCV